MEMFASVLLAVQVLTSLSIIVLVLLQQGKGADMGSSFGGGSAGSLFGASGAANFLSRMTKWAAIVFFASTIGLAWVAHHPTGSILDGGVMQGFDRGQPAAPAGSEIPGAEIPGGAEMPAPGAIPQDAPASVPQVPSAPEADSAAPSADVPAASSGNITEGAGVPAEPAAGATVENN